MDLFEFIIKEIGLPGVIAAIITFSATNLIKYLSDKNLEKNKNELSNEYNRNMEIYKHELNKRIIEHDISYKRIYEKKLDAVHEIYKRIIEFQNSASFLVSVIEQSSWPSKKERYEEYNKKYKELYEYYSMNRLFLDEDITKKIDGFIKQISDQIIFFKNSVVKNEDKGLDERAENIWEKSCELIQNETPKILKDIEQDFRKTLKIFENYV